MSLLRQLCDLELLAEDPAAALLAAALRVRRAGLEHLVVGEVSESEVNAMVMAGEQLQTERAILVSRALTSPDEVLAILDGGESQARNFLRGLLDRVKEHAK